MGLLAVACGALIVAFGLITTRHAPSDAQFGTEITCLVGGLVLVFLGLTLRRLDSLARAVDAVAQREVTQREAGERAPPEA